MSTIFFTTFPPPSGTAGQEVRAGPAQLDLAGFTAAFGDRGHPGKLQDLGGRAEAVTPRPEGRLQAGSKDRSGRGETGKQGRIGLLGKQLADLLLPLLQSGD